jgi:hypothetical protein
MKRSTSLSAMVAAAALLLAGCGNDPGTATPAPSSADLSASATDTSSAGDTSATDESKAASTDESTGASTDESTAASTDESTAASTGESTAASTDQSTEESTVASTDQSTESSDTKPTKTLGADTVMDAKTTKWFSTFCTGMVSMSSVTGFTPDTSSPDKLKTQIVNLYSKIGTAFTTTAANLKPLPAPSFTGGEEFASTLVDGMATSGKAFLSNAAKVKAADPKNKAAFGTLMGEVAKDMSNATKPLADLFNKVQADPAMVKGVQSIPACQKLQMGN